MIIPITGLQNFKHEPVKINDEFLLIKEEENISDKIAFAAYNRKGEQIGYMSTRCSNNPKVNAVLQHRYLICTVYSIGRSQILVEIDMN